MMNGICLRYAANKVEAEDVLQDAFVKAFKNLKAYSGKGPLGAWMRKIAVNTALEQYRSNKSLKNFGLMIDVTEAKLEIDDNAIEQLELEDLLAKIQALPDGFRTVFNLYAVEGYTHKEIGEMLGISDGTSKSQYSRARVMLRDMIQQELDMERKKLSYAK